MFVQSHFLLFVIFVSIFKRPPLPISLTNPIYSGLGAPNGFLRLCQGIADIGRRQALIGRVPISCLASIASSTQSKKKIKLSLKAKKKEIEKNRT